MKRRTFFGAIGSAIAGLFGVGAKAESLKPATWRGGELPPTGPLYARNTADTENVRVFTDPDGNVWSRRWDRPFEFAEPDVREFTAANPFGVREGEMLTFDGAGDVRAVRSSDFLDVKVGESEIVYADTDGVVIRKRLSFDFPDVNWSEEPAVITESEMKAILRDRLEAYRREATIRFDVPPESGSPSVVIRGDVRIGGNVRIRSKI